MNNSAAHVVPLRAAEGTPVSKGKKTFYPGKVMRPVTTNLTQESRDALDASVAKASSSASDVLEHAVRKLHGLPVNPDLDHALAS